jgi:hypothetical protein
MSDRVPTLPVAPSADVTTIATGPGDEPAGDPAGATVRG